MNDFMQQKRNITDLLSRFLSGTITPRENGELHRYLIDDNHKDEVIDWLQEQWISESLPVDEAPGEPLFTKIMAEIQKNHHTYKAVAGKRRWMMIFRYAAIFIFAFGLSWVVQMYVSHEKSEMAEGEFLYTEILVPYGSKNLVVLPDSTKVLLNAGARLKYPVSYDGKTREVFLQGEGFFDVTEDKEHPFIVKTNGLDIKVHGTKFNLMANADDNIIEAMLVEGAIEILGVKDAKSEGNANLMMTPGQKLTLQKEKDSYSVLDKEEETTLTIPKEMVEPVKIKNAVLSEKSDAAELSTAWTENRMVFVKERFEIVKTRLERWYGVDIEVRNPEILDYRFTGTFDKETFEQAMSALSKAAHCDFKIDKTHVIVTKNN